MHCTSAVKYADRHRRAPAIRWVCRKFPKSVFDFANELCADGANDAIHRCLSIARLYSAVKYVDEEIPIVGLMKEDFDDFIELTRDETCDTARRISFWRRKGCNVDDKHEKVYTRCSLARHTHGLTCIGYMILVKTGRQNNSRDYRWIVYEAVMDGGDMLRGILPRQTSYCFSMGRNEKTVKVRGRLYCQQNGVTTVCAHVAIRTILSALLPAGDVSYRTITRYAKEEGFNLNEVDEEGGMTTIQIMHVFKRFGFSVHLWGCDDNGNSSGGRKIPIYHCIYSGIESGGGCLMGFHVTNSEKTPQHIIPLVGHTFNKHIWVNDAAGCYFKQDTDIHSYLSDNWVSTFIGHDDNIGPNIYIPRFYVQRSAVSTAFSIIPTRGIPPANWRYQQCVDVECVANVWLADHVGEWLRRWPQGKLSAFNPWLERLLHALPHGGENTSVLGGETVSQQQYTQVVFRSLLVSKRQYIQHLRKSRDWQTGQKEVGETIDAVAGELSRMDFIQSPSYFWMVEISLPHLFPVNERKIGELLFPALEFGEEEKREIRHPQWELKSPIVIRIPSYYLFPLFPESDVQNPLVEFDNISSLLSTHVKCYVYKGSHREG